MVNKLKSQETNIKQITGRALLEESDQNADSSEYEEIDDKELEAYGQELDEKQQDQL